MVGLAQNQPLHLQVPVEKGGSVGGSTETWVGSCLQDPTVEGVKNSNGARLARAPTNWNHLIQQ